MQSSCSNPQIDTNPFLIFKATNERNTLFRSILTNSSTLSPSCKERVLATLLQNQELLDDLSTKESQNLLALAQGIRATPWPIEESDDEVNEADLQAALEASKKADNVVPFFSSGTVSLPVSFSPSLVSSLPSAVKIALKFLGNYLKMACSPLLKPRTPFSSLLLRLSQPRLRPASLASVLRRRKLPPHRRMSAKQLCKLRVQCAATCCPGCELHRAPSDLMQIAPSGSSNLSKHEITICAISIDNPVVPIPKAATSNIGLSKVFCSNSQAATLSAAVSKIPPTNLTVYSGPSSDTQNCKSTVAQMEKMLLQDKKLLQSFEADDVDSASTR
nr:uncharacterized protein LOC109146977 [Ipomoea batatas]